MEIITKGINPIRMVFLADFRRYVAVALFLFCLGQETRMYGQTDPGAVDLSSRESARTWFNTWWPKTYGVPMGFTGNVAAGVAGDTSQAFKDEVALRLNVFRRMCGLQPVTLNATYNAKDQQAALMMSANGQLDHAPPSTWLYFTSDGYSAAQHSNLALGVSGPSAILGYMFDPGAANHAVGHRIFQLIPALQVMGTGDVPGSGSLRDVNALWTDDASGVTSNYQYNNPLVYWPARGYIPHYLIPGRWSIFTREKDDGTTVDDTDLRSISVKVTKNGQAINVTLSAVFSEAVWTLDGTSEGDTNYATTVVNGESIDGTKNESQDNVYHVTIDNIKIFPAETLLNGTGHIEYDVIGYDPSSGAVKITKQPTSATVTVAHAVNFTGGADGAPSYQWQVSTNTGATWTNTSDGATYAGSKTAALTVSGVTAGMNGTLYRYVATSGNVTATSDAATLSVVPAQFPGPTGIAVDGSGNLYVADGTNNTVQKVNPSLQASVMAGSNGQQGSADGLGSAALFRQPGNLARDSAGTLYLADSGNSLIRKITSNGNVTTLAGSSSHQSYQDGTGANAWFNAPNGISVGSAGLTVADSLNDVIRRLNDSAVSSTLAGAAGAMGSTDALGTSARFNRPGGVADSSGTLFIADTFNHTIRKISPDGTVSTFAGTPGISGTTDGTGNLALFNLPTGIATDTSGNVYVADTGNATIRKITASGAVSTLAGLGTIAGLKDGTGSDAWFNQPKSIAVDASGNVFVADTGNATIRKVTLAGVVTTLVITAAATGNGPTITGQPAATSVSVGNVATFTVAANGNPNPGFQWQRLAIGASAWVNLSDVGGYMGTAATTLSVSGTTTAMSGDQFRCVVSNSGGNVTSNAATLTVTTAPPNAGGGGGGGGALSYWFFLALSGLGIARRVQNLRYRQTA